MTIDTAALRATAEAANSGPWEVDYSQSDRGNLWIDGNGDQSFTIAMQGTDADAAHIAAMDPATTLALLDELDTLKGVVRRTQGLADAFADDGLQRHGGNIAWHIEEAIANEKDEFPDAADMRIASQRERAEAAEALLKLRSDALNRVAAENDQLRAQVARVEKLADDWGDWPITAQGQAADLLREIREALSEP